MDVDQCFPNFLLANPFSLRKLTWDPHDVAHVILGCPDNSTQNRISVSQIWYY
jgi:hypothetical protein